MIRRRLSVALIAQYPSAQVLHERFLAMFGPKG
jgi:hypothetical protein